MVVLYAVTEDAGKWNAYLPGYKTIVAFWFVMTVFLRITSLSFIWLAS